MIFNRRTMRRTYSDYTRYRPFLRKDFLFRCAYCLRNEFFVRGEAGCVIDHHRPQHGPFGRPDLISVYENLYWCCVECNSIKGDTWPSPEELAEERRFLDPCQPEDDHSLHWDVEEDGRLNSLTSVGEYTIDKLVLNREGLIYYRHRRLRWECEYEELRTFLAEWELEESVRVVVEARLAELASWIEPPVFDRPRRRG